MEAKHLRLKAGDVEDLEVISAVLQDAIVPLCDISYQAAEETFVMVLQRFCWCDSPEKVSNRNVDELCFERIRCAVSIEGVKSVQVHGIDQSKHGVILELLAVLMKDGEIRVIFAGNAEIRLSLENWSLKLEDFGESWPSFCQPVHVA